MTTSEETCFEHMSGKRKQLSIKHTIVLVFGIVMIASIIAILSLVLTRWTRSAQNTSLQIAETIADNVSDQIISFLRIPLKVSEENHTVIENGILNLDDEVNREKFFVDTFAAQERQIYSFSIGTVNGEYYGARRNEKGDIEIMKNNASTGGHSWYYSVSEDHTAGDIAVKLNEFDPRTRAWYKAAVEHAGPVFSPVYQHFVMNDLTISAAAPVVDHRTGELIGVMGTHILLGDAGAFLSGQVSDYGGYAFIVEKESGLLIANSLGKSNFTVNQDNTSQRISLSELDDPAAEALSTFMHRKLSSGISSGSNWKEKLYVNAQEVELPGIDWMIITAIPEHYLYENIRKSIGMVGYLTLFTLLLAITIYYLMANRLWKPMKSLLEAADGFASGDLDRRAEVVRNDEIGVIAESLNGVASKLQYLINNLEKIVEERTEELHAVNTDLDESRIQLATLLDSTAEGIYGIDLEGNCTFCNTATISLLGYEKQEDLLGRNIHDMIHHTGPIGIPCTPEGCPVICSLLRGEAYSSENDLFRRADGTTFSVSFHSHPRYRDGKIVGGVISFLDISERKEKEAQIEYLRCHDPLSGLLNRSHLEELYERINAPENLPIAVIFGDLNGLKMTNDVFGHAAGDELISRAAQVLRSSIREGDLAARVGGDEFLILLPKTEEAQANEVMNRIRRGFSESRIIAIKYSMALGCALKHEPFENLETIIDSAETLMYKDKLQNKKNNDKETISTIQELLESKKKNSWNKSREAKELCRKLAKAFNLTKVDTLRLQKALRFHDIGMITLDEHHFEKKALTEEEFSAFQMHPVMGYRILNLFDDMLDIAETVYTQHEHWDGSGVPRELKGEQIPLLSRILSVIEMYDYYIHVEFEKKSQEEVIAALLSQSGTFFDPSVVNTFISVISGNSNPAD